MIEALPIKLVPLQWNLYWSHKELRINTTPALHRKKQLPKWIRIWLKTHLFQLRPLIVLYSLKCPVLEKCYQSFQNQPDRENHTITKMKNSNRAYNWSKQPHISTILHCASCHGTYFQGYPIQQSTKEYTPL